MDFSLNFPSQNVSLPTYTRPTKTTTTIQSVISTSRTGDPIYIHSDKTNTYSVVDSLPKRPSAISKQSSALYQLNSQNLNLGESRTSYNHYTMASKIPNSSCAFPNLIGRQPRVTEPRHSRENTFNAFNQNNTNTRHDVGSNLVLLNNRSSQYPHGRLAPFDPNRPYLYNVACESNMINSNSKSADVSQPLFSNNAYPHYPNQLPHYNANITSNSNSNYNMERPFFLTSLNLLHAVMNCLPLTTYQLIIQTDLLSGIPIIAIRKMQDLN